MLPFSLVAIDLDDTLLNGRLEISELTKETIRQVRSLGVMVTLSTGRMFRSALPYAQSLGLDIPLITYQGALVKNAFTGKVLYHRPVPCESAFALIQRIRKFGYHINIYLDDRLYVERITPEAELYNSIANVELYPVGDLLSFLQGDPSKMVVVHQDESKLDELAEVLHEEFRDKLYITKSKPYFLEMMHPEATKGRALKALAELYRIPRQQVMAFGDSFNDLDMLRFAGMGIAMGNARAEVRQAADYVTLSNEEDGVALALRKFIIEPMEGLS